MSYLISKPSPALSRYVKHYWALDNCFSPGQQHVQRIVPTGLLDLTFYFEDKPIPKDENKTANENILLSGQLGSFYDITVSGKLSLFSILFKPHGLSMFLDIPISELYNQNVPLNFLFKKDINELETLLSENNSFIARIRIIEHYLLGLLKKKYKQRNNLERIEHSIDIINHHRGQVSINQLASETCFSRKQFERVFSHHIGTSPKQFLKTIRFQSAIHARSKNANISLLDLTFNCGYYDQSHMINDFQKLSGMSPGQYFKDCEAYSDYFQ